MIGVGDRLLVGTQDTATGASTGLAVSTDFGETYSAVAFTGDIGDDRHVQDFSMIDSRLYMAAGAAGLLVSQDSGATWERILYDSVTTSTVYNTANGLATLGDSLLIGTDTGLVCLTLDGTGAIIDRKYIRFADNVFFGAKVIGVRVQHFESDTLPGLIDSTVFWTVNREMSPAGSEMIARSNDLNDTLSWASYLFDTLSYDIGFVGDTAIIVGEAGIRFMLPGPGVEPDHIFPVFDSVNTSVTMNDDTVYAMRVIGDTVFLGSNHGVAISTDGGQSFAIRQGNTDSLRADVVVNFTRGNTMIIDTSVLILGLTGDFIPALGVQPRNDGLGRIWASGRPTGIGSPGISVGMYVPRVDTLGDTVGLSMRWRALYGGDFAWNFAFYGDSTVYAATNAGVLVNTGDTSEVWDTMTFVDENGLELLRPGTPAFGVEVIDDNLWVGTSDGTIRFNLTDPSDQQLFVVVDSTSASDEVYAFPVPFSPNRGGECDFRFVVQEDANITIEIYDFAMNLVARPIDNVFYPAGYYPSGAYQRISWDGLNGQGEVVAVGVYYFKVKSSTGEVRWGKLAVIP
jgi:hypothetical protein